MRALILGGSGFIGRNLVSHLEEQGETVAVLDRAPDPLGGLSGEFVEGDAQDPEVVWNAIRQARPDVIYHLAANSDISAGIADASLDFGDTLLTTMSLAQACQREPVEEIVFASSSAIFGVMNSRIAENSEEFFQPISWYGKAKLASELVIQSLSTQSPSTRVLIARFPNVVGPKATHGVLFDFLRKLQLDPSLLQVLGNGLQEKPYIHVGDLILGIEHFRKLMIISGISRINLGPADTVNVRTIVQEVLSATGLTPEVRYQDTPYGWEGDVPKYAFDTSKMIDSGFEVSLSSQEAVRHAIRDLLADSVLITN